MNFLLITFIIGAIGGVLLMKLKLPGGLIIGSIFAVAIFNIVTGLAYVPQEGRILAQIIAGAYIGTGVSKNDLIEMKIVFKPALLVVLSLLSLSIIMGIILWLISPMDLVTSLMSSIPGGLSYVPIVSEELGADSSKVAILQFVRLIFGIGIFPYIIHYYNHRTLKQLPKSNRKVNNTLTTDNKRRGYDGLITFFIASIFGILGYFSGIPSATLVFAMLSIAVLKIYTNKAFLPKWVKQFAQILAGTYIGRGIGIEDLLELKYLFIPSLVIIFGYLGSCFLIGIILNKNFGLTLEEGMFSASPAGASDMALILEDFGVDSKKVIVIQIFRMMVVVSLFPQIMLVLSTLFERF